MHYWKFAKLHEAAPREKVLKSRVAVAILAYENGDKTP